MKERKIIILGVLFVLLSFNSLGYKIDPPANVHQHMTNESQKIWILVPYEIKQYFEGGAL
ncbi:hypothetical protein HQ529_04715 [Candidatus Woesearchaeota archaeon]|nr:hypothetical protein [Candidatus Woesearchaeota archaeon]